MAKHFTGAPAAHAAKAGGTGAHRYHRDAMLAVLRIMGFLGEDVALVFATIVKLRGDRCGENARALPLDAMAAALGLDCDAFRTKLLDIDRRFASAFSINLLDWQWCRAALDVTRASSKDLPRRDRDSRRFEDESVLEGEGVLEDRADPGQVLLNEEFIALLDDRLPDAARATLVPNSIRQAALG